MGNFGFKVERSPPERIPCMTQKLKSGSDYGISKKKIGMGSILELGERVSFNVAMLITAIMMILISLDALLRYLFNSPISGAYEINQDFLMVAIVFLSLSFTYTGGDHINVDTFVKYIPAAVNRALQLLFRLMILIFVALLVYASWSKTLGAIQQKEYSSGGITYPLAWAYILVPVGSAILLLRLVYEFFSGDKNRGSDRKDEAYIS